MIVHNEKAMRISAGTLGYIKGPAGAAGTRCLVLSFLICGSYLNDQSHPKNGKVCDSPVLILLSVKYYLLLKMYYSKCLIFLEFQLSQHLQMPHLLLTPHTQDSDSFAFFKF